jgi:hypothetical protein
MTETWAERTANRVLNAIPGYAGYKDKESRRDADRVVRDRLASELASRADRVERVATQLAEQRRIGDVGPVNRFAAAIRLLRDRINTASYGYGGLFGNRDVDASVLDQIKLFDESLFAGLEAIDSATTQLEQAVSSGGDLSAAGAAGESAVAQASTRFDQRKQIIESAIPASPEQMSGVLAVLETPEQRREAASPPPAFELHDRDALAVQGDNFVVDARVDVEATSGSFRVFRLDVAPEKWLFVPKTRGGSFALLTPATGSYSPGPPPSIDGEAYAIETTGHGNGELIGAGGQSGRRPVAYTLLRGEGESSNRALVLQWGAEQQLLTGTAVHPDDVEIFGKPN